MAYQTSTTIASLDALINAIRAFAVANGWQEMRNTSNGSLRTVTLRKTGVTDYVHIYNTNTNELRMRVSVGFDTSLTPAQQPNPGPSDSVSNQLTGPYPAVWFFANGDEIDIVVRRSDLAAAYSHVTFGRLRKYGEYTGGTFVDGSFWNQTSSDSGSWGQSFDHAPWGMGTINAGHLRCDSDGLTNNFFRIAGGQVGSELLAFSGVGTMEVANLYTANQALPTYLEGALVGATDDNTFSARSFLHPFDVHVPRAGSPRYYSPVGFPDNRRFCSLAKFNPEQEITIADETWVVFPVVRKAAMVSTLNAPNASGNYGYAIRKVA